MNEITLDSILVHIGQFGKYQMLNYLILALPMFLNSIFSVTYVFTASSVLHRCNITECDSTGSSFHEPWVNFTIPVSGKGELSQCTRFATGGDLTGQCDQRGFDNVVEKCDSFIVDEKQSSISNEVSFFYICIWISFSSDSENYLILSHFLSGILYFVLILTRRRNNLIQQCLLFCRGSLKLFCAV